MQRNWDVIRKILLLVEALPTPESSVDSDQVNGIAPAVAAYHMRLLVAAGLAAGGGRCSMPGAAEWRFIDSLTWQGHELLDSIRNDGIWNKIRAVARDKGVDLTFDAVKAIAKVVIEGMLG